MANQNVIFGGHLEWHTPEERPDYSREILVAFTYVKGCNYDNLVDGLYFSVSMVYLKKTGGDTYPIAWAYINTDVPSMMLDKILKERAAVDEKFKEEYKAKRIAELEAEIEKVKNS